MPKLRNLLAILLLLLVALPIPRSNADDLPRVKVDKKSVTGTKQTFYFPGYAPNSSVLVRFTDVGYKKSVRSNQCGIYTLKLPKAFNPTNGALNHNLFTPSSQFAWTVTPAVMDEPVCNGSEYVGPKWSSSFGDYYLFRKGNVVKFWQAGSFVSNSLTYLTDEWANPLEKTLKADSCGVVKVTTTWDDPNNFGVFSGKSAYLIWDLYEDNPWVVGGVTHSQNYLETSPGEYICKNGVLYK